MPTTPYMAQGDLLVLESIYFDELFTVSSLVYGPGGPACVGELLFRQAFYCFVRKRRSCNYNYS